MKADIAIINHTFTQAYRSYQTYWAISHRLNILESKTVAKRLPRLLSTTVDAALKTLQKVFYYYFASNKSLGSFY